MIEIRFHGRGGQGAVIASKILATAVFFEGKYSQCFPAFGAERRGAPVTAFLRVDGKPIRIRSEIYEPDHLVVLDPLLIEQVPLTNGLKPGGTVIINSTKQPKELKTTFGDLKNAKVATVAASSIARKHELGTPQAPIVNTAILGAVAGVLGIVTMENLIQAVKEEVPLRSEANMNAVKEAFEKVTETVKI